LHEVTHRKTSVSTNETCTKAAHLEEHDGDVTGVEKLVTQTLIKLWNVHSRLHDAEV